MNQTKPLLLVDGSNLVYRVFYAFQHLFTSYGHFSGGVYGMAKMLNFYCEKFGSNKIIIAWDSKGNWRKDLTKSYKEHRHNKQKDSIMDTMKEIQEFCRYCGIVTIKKEGLEADDLIAMVCRAVGENVAIVTGDKDMLQLIDDSKNIFVVRPGKGGEVKILHEKEAEEVFGVKAEHIKYYLALTGDGVDEIKGVPGYGKAKAKDTLKYKVTINVKKRLLRWLNLNDRKIFLLNLKLIELTNLPFRLGKDSLYSYKPPNKNKLDKMLKDLQIRKFVGFELIQKFHNKKFKVNFLRQVMKDSHYEI
jgi:5'-3' exonuclease